MFVPNAELHRAPAKLQNVFAGDGRVPKFVKFPACPVRGDADRRVGREPMPLGLAAEIHVDGDVAAPMDVDMAVAVDFENGKRQTDIYGGLFVRAVISLIPFVQRFDAFANKYVEPVRLFPDDLKANQNPPSVSLAAPVPTLGLPPGRERNARFLGFP